MKRLARRSGLLVVISGPSGVGKSTVVNRLLKKHPELVNSISLSTRPPRPMEKHGLDYFFVTDSEFFKHVKSKGLIEWAEVHGYYYGTPRSFVMDQLDSGKAVILEVDVQGAQQIRAAADKGRIKSGSAVFIFLIPPSVDILTLRLRRRKTEKEEEQMYRLKAAMTELAFMEKYDYIVVNDTVESAADKIHAIIAVEKERNVIH